MDSTTQQKINEIDSDKEGQISQATEEANQEKEELAQELESESEEIRSTQE